MQMVGDLQRVLFDIGQGCRLLRFMVYGIRNSRVIRDLWVCVGNWLDENVVEMMGRCSRRRGEVLCVTFVGLWFGGFCLLMWNLRSKGLCIYVGPRAPREDLV